MKTFIGVMVFFFIVFLFLVLIELSLLENAIVVTHFYYDDQTCQLGLITKNGEKRFSEYMSSLECNNFKKQEIVNLRSSHCNNYQKFQNKCLYKVQKVPK